jgi:hypothetical protein
MDSPESKAIRWKMWSDAPASASHLTDGRVISAAGVRNFLFARRSRISPTQSMRRTPCLLLSSRCQLLSSPAGAQSPDWAATASETLAHLQRLIRINTVNPRGTNLLWLSISTARSRRGDRDALFEPARGVLHSLRDSAAMARDVP